MACCGLESITHCSSPTLIIVSPGAAFCGLMYHFVFLVSSSVDVDHRLSSCTSEYSDLLGTLSLMVRHSEVGVHP